MNHSVQNVNQTEASVQARQSATFKSILIANRGEIAARIIRTARRLGYKTIAVYSEQDEHALHARLADRAVCIYGRAPKDSYLSIERIIDACRKAGADAVHPGYGFLSENCEFARACALNSLVFIGPTAAAIECMGHKSRAKALMIEAGVPCIPGYQGNAQETDILLLKAREIGLPLMIKAAAGGGGRGLRLVHSFDDLPALLQSARQEAESAFGSGELLLERALTAARHVEVQVFGDLHGNVVHLGERDCSIQRRHQKVFEESPSPAVSPALREEMGRTAIRAAQAINYVGAGTVEFLLDKDGRFYFLEMNTRLQVEHPVTEMITGIDLVEWQLLVAAGYPLPLKQEEITFQGHSIEARLYAEDPADEFRPQVGKILYFSPPSTEFARTDHSLNISDEVSPYYDAMMAKVITFGPDRATATRRLMRALNDTVVLGIKTNRQFLLHCLAQPQFIAGEADTGFIAEVWPARTIPHSPANYDADLVLMAVAVLLWQGRSTDQLSAWCSSGQMRSTMKLTVDETVPLSATIRFLSKGIWQISIGASTKTISAVHMEQHAGEFVLDGMKRKVAFAVLSEIVYICSDEFTHVIEDVTFKPPRIDSGRSDGDIVAPANGLIGSVDIEVGQMVEQGQRILTLESMKLMQTVCAPLTGVVSALLVSPGQQVKAKQLVAQIETGSDAPSKSQAPKAIS